MYIHSGKGFACLDFFELDYEFKTSKIPNYTLDELSIISRKFLWGKMGDDRKLHTVRWEEIFQPNLERFSALGTSIR